MLIGHQFMAVVLIIPCTVINGVVVADGNRAQPSLDDLLGITQPATGPQTPPPRGQDDPPVQSSSPVELEPDVLRQLTDQSLPDVFGQAVGQMEQAADRLDAKLDAGLETQRLQQSVLAKLDQVIAAAQKQGLGSGSSGSSSPSGKAGQQEFGSAKNTGSQRHTTSSGLQAAGGGGSRGGVDDAAGQRESPAMQDHRSQWGNLPERLRQELLEGFNERFSSVYRELTGQYYRRLAQEGQ